MSEPLERERLDVDLLFVGAGAATLSSVIRLASLCRERELEMPSVLVIEKAAEIGGHQLSGAVIDPSGIRELFPDYASRGFPIQHEVTDEAVYFLTEKRAFRLPVTPPPMANHGNLVVSLSDVVLAAPYRDAAAAHRFDGFDGGVPLGTINIRIGSE